MGVYEDNLLGTPAPKKRAGLIGAENVGVISIHELREIRNKTVKGQKADAAIIS